jgi:lipopolysaccharide transport system ATP-binding protein
MDAIAVNAVSKRYAIYRHRWDRLADWVSPERADRRPAHWALRNVSLRVGVGESVGIVGRNGAGKSTLLKIITGTTTPSAGHVATAGRVAALLELGMGFHPDFTGRENLIIAGQLQGFSVDEIRAREPEIEAFAEIGDYIDEPVRTYSSGMQVRLAFSLATAVRPNVLIVDEALSVGDIYFQQKCFERILTFKQSGTTILFVSHDLGAVTHLCDRAILLEKGEVTHDGAPKAVVDLFQASMLAAADRRPEAMAIARDADSGAVGQISTPDVDVLSVQVQDAREQPAESVISDDPGGILVRVRFNRALKDPHIGFKLRDRLGRVLYETNTYCMGKTLGAVAAGGEMAVRFGMRFAIAPGDYTVTIGVAEDGYAEGSFRQVLALINEHTAFRVLRNPHTDTWAGLINLAPDLRRVA